MSSEPTLVGGVTAKWGSRDVEIGVYLAEGEIRLNPEFDRNLWPLAEAIAALLVHCQDLSVVRGGGN